MNTRRTERVGQLIREELSLIVLKEVKDPRIGSLEITRVKVSPDLREASVFYRVVGRDVDPNIVAEALQRASGFFQKKLGQKLALRTTPLIRFQYDATLEEAIRVEALLEEVKTD